MRLLHETFSDGTEIAKEAALVGRVEDFDVMLERADFRELLKALVALIFHVWVHLVVMTFDVVEVLPAKAAVELVLGHVSHHVLLQPRLLAESSTASIEVTLVRSDFLVDGNLVAIKSGLLAKCLATLVALVLPQPQVNDSVVACEARGARKLFVTNCAFIRDVCCVRSLVRVVSASDLKQQPAVGALVGVSLLLVDSLMLCEISCCVVGLWTLVTDEISSVDMVGEMVLKVVRA